jgi:ribosome maturation factor RimP
MDLQQKIEELAKPYLDQIGAFVIDVQIVPEGQNKVIQLFADTDTGITIDQCAEVSRILAKAIELQHVIQDSYVLQVSSPGLKKPLKFLSQYKKNIGRLFRVRFQINDGITEVIAKLTSVEGEILKYDAEDNKTYEIPFNKIIESIEVLPW